MSELRISMADIMRAGYCPSGARRWFEGHGLDAQFKTLIKGGSMPADELLATQDAAGSRVVKAKIEREWRDGDPSSLVVTAADLRKSKQCMAGARDFAARHGLDWNRLLASGITGKELLDIGDHDALRVLRQKMERGDG